MATKQIHAPSANGSQFAAWTQSSWDDHPTAGAASCGHPTQAALVVPKKPLTARWHSGSLKRKQGTSLQPNHWIRPLLKLLGRASSAAANNAGDFYRKNANHPPTLLPTRTSACQRIQPCVCHCFESHGRPIPVSLHGLHRIKVYNRVGTSSTQQTVDTELQPSVPIVPVVLGGGAQGHSRASQGG